MDSEFCDGDGSAIQKEAKLMLYVLANKKTNIVIFLYWCSCRSVTPVTMQAFSEEDRKLWMEALDGKEAVRI